MRDEHVLDELSAYIDGEARDPARVARHLQHCEDCARRRMELLKLSAHLKALPAPEAQSQFVSRVIARIELETPPARPFWVSVFAPALAGAAALFLLAALGIYAYNLRETPQPPPLARSASPVLSDEQVVDHVALFLQQGGDLSVLEESVSPAFAAPELTSEEDLGDMLALVVVSSSEELPLDSDAGEDDLAAMIDELNPGEVETLQNLISEYVNEG